MPRLGVGALGIALIATACSVTPIEDPGIGAGGLTTTVLAADGSVLAEWHAEEDRQLVAYSDLPKHLVDAVVAIEDRRFWIHNGVDVRAVARATRENVEAGAVVEGGSTITQQYVKNVLLSDDLTLERKAEEIGLALQLETSLTKEEILERYLNTIYLGEGAYGVSAAAKRYFGLPVGSLSLGQSSLLAGLILAPSDLNPYEYPVEALARRDLVLAEMVGLGWIDQAAATAASAEPLDLAVRGVSDLMRFPYFTDEVRRRLLENPALGATADDRYETLTTGGLTIYTTIDPAIQMAAEAAIASVLPEDGPAAALVAIDPRNGHVLAIVGGDGFYDATDPIGQFNLATQGRRQPGSAFKPFTLAAALEYGIELDSTWPGGRAAYIRTADEVWTVRNYKDAYFPGLSLLEATVFSVNVPYAHLINLIGADRVVALAKEMGIDADLAAVPSIVLGTEEVTVFDMAAAYGTFANDGIRVDPVLVSRIEDREGRIIYEHLPTFQRVLGESVAQQVTAALTETVRRGTGQQAKIGRPIAGKSGTTEATHDAWFVGYTPELVAAVWVGFPEGNKPMVAPYTPFTVTGGTWPAQIWSRFGIAALGGVGYADAPEAGVDDLVTVKIDVTTGFLAGPLCPRSNVADIQLRASSVPRIVCPIHNPEGLAVLADGTVPAVGTYTIVDAVSVLEAAGYTIALLWVDVPQVPGTVIGQFPAAGSELPIGSKVELVVAGPEPGTIAPDVLGRHRSDATERFTAVGQEVTVIVVADPNASVEPYRVWAQMPGPGEPVTGRATIWVQPAG
ncbi:MAG: PBP1A family penicillin-binding protein [Acidimicrobiia bacterium]